MAYVDKKLLSYSTVRHVDCQVILKDSLKKSRCNPCSLFRSTLRTFYTRQVHAIPVPVASSKSKKNDRYMSEGELKRKLNDLRERNMAMKGKLRRMESKVANLIEKEAITVKYKILSNDSI